MDIQDLNYHDYPNLDNIILTQTSTLYIIDGQTYEAEYVNDVEQKLTIPTTQT